MKYLNNIKFITSIFNKKDIPEGDFKQVVFAGKSNVGKSSFINAICNNKKMAKVGNTPGKTKCINKFSNNIDLDVFDLPGYGYSKMTKKEQENIGKVVDTFLTNNEKIHMLFLLIDIRHKPTSNDKDMYEWILSKNIPFTIIATKADKIAKTKIHEHINVIRKELFAKEDIIPYSSLNKLNLEEIVEIIENC